MQAFENKKAWWPSSTPPHGNICIAMQRFFAMHGKYFYSKKVFFDIEWKLWTVVHNHETWVPHGINLLRQANEENDMKKIFITFDFHILP